MDISRQQFEEFIKFHAEPAELERELKQANNGINYHHPVIDLMWISWQASRDALKPIGYTSHKELQEMACGIVGIVHRNKNIVNYIPVYIKD